VAMQFEQTPTPAVFVRRDNRFRVTVEVDGREVQAHLPNSGRLTELLIPGRQVWLGPACAAARRTGYDLLLVEHDGLLVSVDARLPNRLLREALMAGGLPPFPEVSALRSEVPRGASRLDFLLDATDGPPIWIEAKSVTLVEDDVALFPDAPTARGRRHLIELQDAVAAGDRAAVVFVVQRDDASAFAPHPMADPAFRTELREASRRGVSVHAVACRVGVCSIEVSHPLPVLLPD